MNPVVCDFVILILDKGFKHYGYKISKIRLPEITQTYYINHLFSRNTYPIIDKITKNIGRLILLSFSTLSKFLILMSFNVILIQLLNFWTLVNIPGLPFPYLLQSWVRNICVFFSSHSLKTREKCISFSQVVVLSLYIFWGKCVYFSIFNDKIHN